jgi:hypothetical protein
LTSIKARACPLAANACADARPIPLAAPVKRIGRSDGIVILRISPRPAAQAVQLTPISRFEKVNPRA